MVVPLIMAGMSIVGMGMGMSARKEEQAAIEQQAEWDAEMAIEDMKVVDLQSNLQTMNLRTTYAAHGAAMQAKSSASGVRVGSGSSAGALVRNAGERAVEEAVESIQNESNKRRLKSGADMAAITADINAKASKRAGAADVVSATRQIIGAYQ